MEAGRLTAEHVVVLVVLVLLLLPVDVDLHVSVLAPGHNNAVTDAVGALNLLAARFDRPRL